MYYYCKLLYKNIYFTYKKYTSQKMDKKKKKKKGAYQSLCFLLFFLFVIEDEANAT